ncbi:outer dense fiber protein 4 [Acomys russatus]|uniref:outer dense fiber protein 4 n=1 Tax=Acomys russatus TaxID=60746 RepID=UPI0021E32E70|nr:outer dense fiber protein 4 [Acomys russatus]
MKADLTEEDVVKLRARNQRSLMDYRRNSLLPFQWRITHSTRWMAQVVASEFSLVAFMVLLVMVFSKKWLYPSKSRFHQRFPKNVTNKIYTSIHTMSTGPLYVCISKSCSEDDKVAFIFLTLMLFPVNLWIYELKKNISVPVGWSYFIGWLVFILYFTCGVLCYLNYKNFWSLIASCSSPKGACNNGVEKSLMGTCQTSCAQEDSLDPAKQNDEQPASSPATDSYICPCHDKK